MLSSGFSEKACLKTAVEKDNRHPLSSIAQAQVHKAQDTYNIHVYKHTEKQVAK